MDKKEKALRFGISILESVSDLLTAAVVGILLVAGLIHYFNWKYDREQEPNPPETATPVIATPEPVSPELLKVLDQQSTELVDGRYLITLEPYSDIPLNVYRTIKHADGKPFRITCGDQWAESGDGSCYCILNGLTRAEAHAGYGTPQVIIDSLNDAGMSRTNTRRTKLSNLRIAQMAATLYCLSTLCTSESAKRRHAARLASVRDAYRGAHGTIPPEQLVCVVLRLPAPSR